MLEGQIASLSPSDAASDYGSQLRARLSGLRILQTQPVSGFRVISTATPPSAPFSPRLVLNAVRAFILGILVATLLNHALAGAVGVWVTRMVDPGTLRRMLETRAALYQEVADAIVSVDHRSPLDVTRAVLRCCA